MAAIRRMDSSSASPLIRVAPILLKQRNAFVALGAVGLSLGAAWAWNHRRKADASDLASDIAPKATSPQKRHRSKRHKSRTKAPAECEQDAPLTEYAADALPPNACSPPASEPGAVPAPAPLMRQQQPAVQEQPQQVQETSPEATPQPGKVTGAESHGSPTASSTGCTQELDVDMADVAATVADTANDATQPPAEPAAGEWRTVERKQRRGRPSPPADCLDESEPEATTAAEAATDAESAAEPPAADAITRPKPLSAEVAPTGEAACAPEEPLAAAPAEGASEVPAKKAKKKKKRPAPPASLRASEEDEPSPAAAEPAPAPAAPAPSPASKLEAPVDADASRRPPPPPPPPPATEPPAEVWVEVTSRRPRRNKRPAALEPRSPRSSSDE